MWEKVHRNVSSEEIRTVFSWDHEWEELFYFHSHSSSLGGRFGLFTPTTLSPTRVTREHSGCRDEVITLTVLLFSYSYGIIKSSFSPPDTDWISSTYWLYVHIQWHYLSWSSLFHRRMMEMWWASCSTNSTNPAGFALILIFLCLKDVEWENALFIVEIFLTISVL